MNKKIKVGDKVRVRSTTVPKGYNFTYAFGIGSIGKVIQNLGYKDSRCVIVKFGDKVTERESYYEDDLDVLEDNTEEIEEIELIGLNFMDMDKNQLKDEINKNRIFINKLRQEIFELRKDKNND